MIPKRRRVPKMGTHTEDGPIRCPQHLQWIRGCVCSVADCTYKLSRVEAAHVRTGTDGSTGKKPGDNFAIPLCYFHHRLQHVKGEAEFERLYGIDMRKIAEELWMKSPHRKKLEQKR